MWAAPGMPGSMMGSSIALWLYPQKVPNDPRLAPWTLAPLGFDAASAPDGVELVPFAVPFFVADLVLVAVATVSLFVCFELADVPCVLEAVEPRPARATFSWTPE